MALESAAPAATYTWTSGGGANTNWSNASNWGGAAPTNNEIGVELVFPALAAPYASNNDLTGLHITSLSITTKVSPGKYTFTGQPITQSEQVTMASPGSGSPNLVWQVPVVLGADVTISTSGRQTQLQGPIDLASRTLRLDAEGDIVLAGVVSGSGNLIKDNTSALTITGTNTYTGSTTSNGGALYIASAAAFGDAGTGTTFNGGFLGFSGSTFTTSEPIVFNGGGGIVAYGMPTIAGQVTLNTTINIQPFDAVAVLTMSGTIGGSGGLNKIGPGLLILNAPSDFYAGATAVDNGTMQLDAALASTRFVSVQSGAKLKGNGSSRGTIAVQGGGTIAPGASPGALSSSGLTMVASAIFAAEINGPNPITQYDTIAVTGPINLGGATLSVTLGYAPPDGQEFTLISQLQDQPVTGTFAALPEGASVHVGSTTFGITYQGGSGNDVVLVAGPTRTPTRVPTGTATPTASISPTPTATAVVPLCIGDCDGSGAVTVDELVLGVNIALETFALTACPQFDADGDGAVTIPELIQAVGNALSSCAADAS